MRNLISRTRKHLLPVLAASVLLTGGISTSLLFAGGTADAAPCAGANVSGAACTIGGQMILTSGSLDLTAPAGVGWATQISGVDQVLGDATAADQTYTVDDATGTAPGWNVQASSTAFTDGDATLGTAGALTPTFSTNGSLGAATDLTAPTATCAGTSTCTVPTNLTTPVAYPVTITAGQAATVTPIRIYSADAGTGVGTINLNPIGWWLAVPSNTVAGTYTSVVSLELVAGP
jgi:hypothetical protein